MKLSSNFVSKWGLQFFLALNLLGASAYLNNFPAFSVTDTGLGKSDHYTIFACFLLALMFIVFRGRIKLAPQNPFFLLLIPHIFLLINGYFLELLQFIVFSIAVMFVTQNSLDRIKIGKIIVACVVVILLFELLMNHSRFMLTTYYQRPRLLLGFFHPKEAGIAIFAAYVFLTLGLKRTYIYLLFIGTLILLFVIDSRNVLLSFLVYNFFRAVVPAFLTPRSAFILFCIVCVCSVIGLYVLAGDFINQLSSSRLSMWTSLRPSIFGPSAGSDIYRQISQISAIRMDSFYIDFLMANGWVPFFILIISLILVGFKISRYSINSDGIPISVYMSLCFFAINDSGMFSTGNLLNFLFWILIVNRTREKNSGTYQL